MKNSQIKSDKLKSFPTNSLHGIVKYLVVPVGIGMVFGWFLKTLYVNKATAGKEENYTCLEPKQNVNPKVAGYEYLNPFLASTQLDNSDLKNFQSEIEKYCEHAKLDNEINSISFYYRDLNNNIWFGVNEDEKFVPASLAKVPIMIAVFQIAEKNPSYLQKKLKFEGTFNSRYLKAHPSIDDIRTTMEEGHEYTIDELVNLTITKSDNEAAEMLFKDFGKNHWDNLSKLLRNKVPVAAPLSENILTVRNFSSFLRILFNASLLNREYSEKALELLSRAEYDKGIRQAFPSSIRVCHKYGERDTAIGPDEIQIQQLHHAGIIYYPGKTFLLCIMTKGSNKTKLQDVIYDLAKIAESNVESSLKKFQQSNIERDIN